mmetsp:Transcript_3828/g.6436  ORF Transcript_3828/g.6436 Transcript_3828/m.6436 type:complete len:494 (+) Transcript_3828:20-1501(+)
MPGIAEELFVDSAKLPLRLYCSICLDVAEAAVITACDHLFCQECIEQLQSTNGQNCECPNCRHSILPINAATNARNFLSQQHVYCSEYESLRCGWTGKYSMWHTHRAKYCKRASEADKNQAKNARVTEIGQYCKEELHSMGVARLKKILQEYLALHTAKLSEQEKASYDYKKYLEKSEYIAAVVRFQTDYGIKSPQKQTKNATTNADTEMIDNDTLPTTYDGLKRLKIRQLSAFLRSKNIDPQSAEYRCLEKSDLIRLVMHTQKHLQDIADGHVYDPTMERSHLPAFQPAHNEADQYVHHIDNEEQDEKQAPVPSASAYHFGAEQLRRSSINRVDLNAANRARNAYSALNADAPSNHAHGYSQHHSNNNNNNNSHHNHNSNTDQSMFHAPNHWQPQWQHANPNPNPHPNQHPPRHPNPSRNPFAFSSETPISSVFSNFSVPQMPDVSGMVDRAMNTVNNTLHSVFHHDHDEQSHSFGASPQQQQRRRHAHNYY